jgi:hypothetical protein
MEAMLRDGECFRSIHGAVMSSAIAKLKQLTGITSSNDHRVLALIQPCERWGVGRKDRN